MRMLALAGMLLLATTTLFAQVPLELRLTTQLPERLPYMYEDRELALINSSSSMVLFPTNAFRLRMFLESQSGWLECRPRVVADSMPVGDVEWEEIDPGGLMPLALPASRCLCQGKGNRQCDEWTVRPGVHKVKAVLTTFVGEATIPQGWFRGTLESNVMEIRITEPSGDDAHAISWAKGSPMKAEVLQKFPASTYAAFFVHGISARISEVDPVATRELIERGLYPGANSVPTLDGWASLDSKGVALWQLEWGHRILRQHPSFPFRDDIRISIALAQMTLGKTQEARQTIESVAEAGDTDAAQWSRKFLGYHPSQTEPR